MKRRILLGLVVVVLAGGALWFRPPRVLLNWFKNVPVSAEEGARLVEAYGCRSCHRIGGRGALKAPDLDGITRKADDPAHVVLRLWLRDPSAVKPNTNMPNFRLSDAEIEAILMYLEALDSGSSSETPEGSAND